MRQRWGSDSRGAGAAGGGTVSTMRRAGCLAWRLLDRLQAKKTDPLAALRAQTEGCPNVLGGVLFVRMPLVLPPKPQWETEYLDWQREWHASKGRHRPWPEWLETGEGQAQGRGQAAGAAGGAEGEDDERREAAPLEQEADRTGDRRTTRRRLDAHLYLLLKGKQSERWFFPSVRHEARETLRQTCERALGTYVDDKGIETFFVGNGPCGVLPAATAAAGDASVTATPDGDAEASVFLVPVELIKGTPKIAKAAAGEVSDFAWVAKDEMAEYFDGAETREYLEKLLQDKSDYYGSGTSQTY